MNKTILYQTDNKFKEEEYIEINRIASWIRDTFRQSPLTTDTLKQIEIEGEILFKESDKIELITQEHHDLKINYSPTEGIQIFIKKES